MIEEKSDAKVLALNTDKYKFGSDVFLEMKVEMKSL